MEGRNEAKITVTDPSRVLAVFLRENGAVLVTPKREDIEEVQRRVLMVEEMQGERTGNPIEKEKFKIDTPKYSADQ